MYVDDILLSGTKSSIEDTKKLIKNKFKIKDIGKVDFIIRIKFINHKHGYFLNQSRYLKEILEKFNKSNVSPIRHMTPVENKELRKIKFDETKYRSVIGNFLYLRICTRPDIIYAVSKAARKSKEPNLEDWNNVVKIFRYLKDTSEYGLNFTRDQNIMAFVDAD